MEDPQPAIDRGALGWIVFALADERLWLERLVPTLI